MLLLGGARGVNDLDFIARTNGKAYLGFIADAELFTLIAELELKIYPFDIVFFGRSLILRQKEAFRI